MFKRSPLTRRRDKKREGKKYGEDEISAAGNAMRIASRTADHAAAAGASAVRGHSLRCEKLRATNTKTDRRSKSISGDSTAISATLPKRRQSTAYAPGSAANG